MIIVFCVTTILFLLNNDSTPYSFAFAPRHGGKGGMRGGKSDGGRKGGGQGGEGGGQGGESSGPEQCCPCSGVQAPSQNKLLDHLKKLKELQGKGPQGKVPQGKVPQGKGPQGKGPQGKVPQGKVPQGKGPGVNDPDNKSIPELDLIINKCKNASSNDMESCILSLLNQLPNQPQNLLPAK